MSAKKGITLNELKERIYDRFGIDRRLTIIVKMNDSPCPDIINECGFLSFTTVDDFHSLPPIIESDDEED